jgi:hypothetical protein
VNRYTVGARRALGAIVRSRRDDAPPLGDDRPAAVLAGPSARDGRAHLARLGAIGSRRSSAAVRHTGHGALELWSAGAPVRYVLDERGEVTVEFANGFVLMARARLAGTDAMYLTPLRRDLSALEMLLVPTGA